MESKLKKAFHWTITMVNCVFLQSKFHSQEKTPNKSQLGNKPDPELIKCVLVRLTKKY